MAMAQAWQGVFPFNAAHTGVQAKQMAACVGVNIFIVVVDIGHAGHAS